MQNSIKKPKVIPPALLLAGLILCAALFFFLPQYNIIPFPFNFAGLALCFWGISLSGKARDIMNKRDTTYNYDKSAALVDEGIFAKTRNPMYLGMTLLLLGAAIAFHNVFALAAPIIFFIVSDRVYAPYEEAKMKATFGDSFEEYKNRVPRWF